MNKIICFICLVFISLGAYATEMCAHRDTTVVPIDATVNSIAGGGFDKVEWVWFNNYSYGKIYGTATCLSLQEIRDIVGDQNIKYIYFPYILPTDDYELMGRSEYYNGDTSNSEYERKYCFCKLTHPMSSQWAFNSGISSASTCKDFCADYCVRNSHAGVDFRTILFRSIGK